MKKFFCIMLACSFVAFCACGTEIKPDTGSDTSVEESRAEQGSTESVESASFEDPEISEESSSESSEESSEEKEPVLVSGDYGYNLVNTVAVICSYSGKDKEIELPSELDGYTVTAITKNVFANNASVEKITLSDTVVKVEDGAFDGCTKLEYVYIGSGVAVLPADAFETCLALKKIEVSSANKSFSSSNGILYNGDKTTLIRCPRATEEEALVLPDTLTLIGKNAFSNCKGLKKVTLTNGCQLSERAFYYCMDLEEIGFGEGVTSIPSKCFFGCVMLEEIVVPDGVLYVGDYAYFGCVKAQKAVLPESVEKIGENVFKSCSALKVIEANGDYCKGWYNETGKDYINT